MFQTFPIYPTQLDNMNISRILSASCKIAEPFLPFFREKERGGKSTPLTMATEVLIAPLLLRSDHKN
jgi:hypothetical protein